MREERRLKHFIMHGRKTWRTTSGVLGRSIHRFNNDLPSLESELSLYIHLVVYVICLRTIPFCCGSWIPLISLLTQLLTHPCNGSVAGRRNLFWRCFAPCMWHIPWMCQNSSCLSLRLPTFQVFLTFSHSWKKLSCLIEFLLCHPWVLD